MSKDVNENIRDENASMRVGKNDSDNIFDYSSPLSVERRKTTSSSNKQSDGLHFIKHTDCSSYKNENNQNSKISKEATNETASFVNENALNIKERLSRWNECNRNNNNLMTKARRKVLQKWMAGKLKGNPNYFTIHEVEGNHF